jgi:hypothetical protein
MYASAMGGSTSKCRVKNDVHGYVGRPRSAGEPVDAVLVERGDGEDREGARGGGEEVGDGREVAVDPVADVDVA